MIRTQIYLTENLHKRLLQIRKLRGTSIAQFIREAIELKLGHSDLETECDILKLSELNITGGDKDLSSNIDQYLYGEEKI